MQCKSIGCFNHLLSPGDFCPSCMSKDSQEPLSTRYPQQYRAVGDISEIDVYEVNHLFNVQDPSGCLQQVVIKLLGSSSSNTAFEDIRQARDLLTRWLQLNQPKEAL